MFGNQLSIFTDTSIPMTAIILRLLLAIILGGIIGFERERRNISAGLRTHMLVSLAAALFALLTLEILENPSLEADRVRIDPIRILEAMTSGVAFLAAGAIIQSRGEVRGLTTGAGLWLAGALGTAAGLGYGLIALVASLMGLVIMAALRWIEPTIQADDQGSESRKNNGSTSRKK